MIYGRNLPAVKVTPFIAPKTDITTPRGIRKLAGPRTLSAHSYNSTVTINNSLVHSTIRLTKPTAEDAMISLGVRTARYAMLVST